jgi:hypothetical protein
VTVPNGTTLTALIATFTTNGDSVKVGSITQVSGATSNDFTSPVSYVVTDTGGSTTYTVTVNAGVNLPKTGQIVSYGTGTIDDGGLQRGIAWPNPRFAVGTGAEVDCVTDNLTGLMWVKMPDATPWPWQTALDIADVLAICGHTDWRLPNVNELESLANSEPASLATWLNAQGFSNVQADYYWSSTTYAGNTTFAWVVYFGDGFVYYDLKSSPHYVRCVRGQ